MTIELFLTRAAWRLRSYLGTSANSTRVNDEEAIATLLAAEREAARHQLPMFAESRHWQCAHTDQAGWRCVKQAITPPIYGFLMWRLDLPLTRDMCRPFAGGLCAYHLPLLVVPAASWWPESTPEKTEERQEAVER